MRAQPTAKLVTGERGSSSCALRVSRMASSLRPKVARYSPHSRWASGEFGSRSTARSNSCPAPFQVPVVIGLNETQGNVSGGECLIDFERGCGGLPRFGHRVAKGQILG